jgi:hypothetical protein
MVYYWFVINDSFKEIAMFSEFSSMNLVKINLLKQRV